MDHTSLKVTRIRLSVFGPFLGLPWFRPVGKQAGVPRGLSLVNLTLMDIRESQWGSPRHSL